MVNGSVHQFPLRLSGCLRDRMKEMAEASKRSLNAEIIFHLERIAFDPLSDPHGVEHRIPHEASLSAEEKKHG